MIAILSDFGQSEYLGVMKGVIYSIYPNSKIVDLCNTINPHSIKEAAWILFTNFEYFPRGTIFLCVVDPGVGGKRNALAIKTKNYYFIGPDNGLMYPSIKKDGIKITVKLSVRGASRTFHGRDVFAKAAAKLESGESIENLGRKTTLKKKLKFYLKGRTGEIVRIDNFGNIITNLRPLKKRVYDLKYKKIKKKLRLFKTYESTPENELFLIVGSSGTLEISMKEKSASEYLKVEIGNKIKIE